MTTDPLRPAPQVRYRRGAGSLQASGTPGVFVRRLATSRGTSVHGVELKVFRFDAESTTLTHDHRHRHEVDVLAGSGVASINGEERPIGVADHVSVPAWAAHAFRSGGVGLEFLCVEWQEPSESSTPARRGIGHRPPTS